MSSKYLICYLIFSFQVNPRDNVILFEVFDSNRIVSRAGSGINEPLTVYEPFLCFIHLMLFGVQFIAGISAVDPIFTCLRSADFRIHYVSSVEMYFWLWPINLSLLTELFKNQMLFHMVWHHRICVFAAIIHKNRYRNDYYCFHFFFQTRDDFLGLVEIPLSHTQIAAEAQGRDIVAKDYILRPRRWANLVELPLVITTCRLIIIP